jgi:hypothetical protein
MTSPEIVVPESTVSFDSITDLRLYLKKLMDAYELQVFAYGEKTSDLVRETYARDKFKKENMRKIHTNWVPLGPIFMNKIDPLLGETEATTEMLAEFKHKVLVTKGALIAVDKAIEEEREFIPKGRLILYLSYGVPKMLVVKELAGRR